MFDVRSFLFNPSEIYQYLPRRARMRYRLVFIKKAFFPVSIVVGFLLVE